MSATCPNCGKPVPSSALQGLCPECMFKVGAAVPTETASGAGPPGTTTGPASSTGPEEIARHFPQLEIMECLGRGGMGVVYKARQPRLGRWVALKILAPEKEKDPQFAERFTREAQALARLNHTHIVGVYDFGEADGLYYLLMEYVDGMSLRELLQRRKIALEEALAIVPKICEALQYAHEQGIVHRDIKPENILLDKRGQVKIADFGIAKIIGGSPKDATALTGVKDVLGTPHYMAPEQVAQPQSVDHRADIYSLGVVFYEMLTGDLPLGKFAPPSQKVLTDVRLDEVVLHALEEKPERRYQQASHVRMDVETIAGTVRTSAAQGQGSKGGPAVSASVADRPKVSVLSVVGASWVAVFVFGVLVVIYTHTIPWGDTFLFQQRNRALLLALGGLSYAAPFGATILGWIGVTQIRHSGGRRYGMGLALFAGLWFPLLLLDGLIGLGWWGFLANTMPVERAFPGAVDPATFYLSNRIAGWSGLLTLLTSLVVDTLMVRWLVRLVNKPPRGGFGAAPGSGASGRPKAFWSSGGVRKTLGLGSLAILAGTLLWAVYWRVPWGM